MASCVDIPWGHHALGRNELREDLCVPVCVGSYVLLNDAANKLLGCDDCTLGSGWGAGRKFELGVATCKP